MQGFSSALPSVPPEVRARRCLWLEQGRRCCALPLVSSMKAPALILVALGEETPERTREASLSPTFLLYLELGGQGGNPNLDASRDLTT